MQITLLNSMAGPEFAAALDQHVAWDVRWLDLKDGIFGKALIDLTVAEAEQAMALTVARNLSVYCLSSCLFHSAVELGEARFRQELEQIDHLLRLAAVFRPRVVRLLAAQAKAVPPGTDRIAHLRTTSPWLFGLYREAVGRLAAGGFRVVIENEVGDCFLRTPAEVLAFFAELAGGDRVRFTWDAQNLWQCGTFPTLAVYRELRPVLGMLHVKGGQFENAATRRLKWRSGLADASWPVWEIVAAAARDGIEAVCLNPSHGEPKPGYDYRDVTARDLALLRQLLKGIH